jgi:hypothetical protein
VAETRRTIALLRRARLRNRERDAGPMGRPLGTRAFRVGRRVRISSCSSGESTANLTSWVVARPAATCCCRRMKQGSTHPTLRTPPRYRDNAARWYAADLYFNDHHSRRVLEICDTEEPCPVCSRLRAVVPLLADPTRPPGRHYPKQRLSAPKVASEIAIAAAHRFRCSPVLPAAVVILSHLIERIVAVGDAQESCREL